MSDSYLYMFGKAIVMLGVVIAVMLLLLWVLKRYMNRTGGGLSGRYPAPIKVLSTSFLGPKKSVSIVDVAGEVLVLGITAENINCLATIDNPDVLDELKRHETEKPKPIFKLFR
jgi:flagellar protein FliO/FliZ